MQRVIDLAIDGDVEAAEARLEDLVVHRKISGHDQQKAERVIALTRERAKIRQAEKRKASRAKPKRATRRKTKQT